MRLEVTKKTDLVLKAICMLAGQDGRRTGSDIADDVNVSRQIMPKLMEPLVKAGWVASMPGPTGGYELRADLSEISLLDLIEAVEGPTEVEKCVLRGTPCPPTEKCALHEAWFPAREALLEQLRSTSVAEIRDSPAMRGPAG